ncbi:hypothetical protein I7I50_09608 [Histoplasma capsulatum G186AR]|uniref:DUF7587 domain-containing protein n=1 Tax=Ajellomyces capsulatus TaxID=5037 RepID=A0A8H8CZZ5_AJECA|nr:hypothetical protein I7I52_07138 [Histoplasma capsulatum]QSS74433.1 hypothetical protein I7I50_09608 [Histoplasma capsulatum G186AR]
MAAGNIANTDMKEIILNTISNGIDMDPIELPIRHHNQHNIVAMAKTHLSRVEDNSPFISTFSTLLSSRIRSSGS